MNVKKTFEIITAIYSRKPFLDEEGQLIVVPDDLDCLIDAIELYEQLIYRCPDQLSANIQLMFLTKTQDFILSIPLESFRVGISHLEYASREIILRTLDKIYQERLENEELLKYSSILCS